MRKLKWLLVLALAAGAWWDLSRPPSAQFGGVAAVGAIHLYQRTLSPLLGAAGVRCRFTPTCSHYAEAVIRKDGVIKGGLRASRRIARCGPWTPRGTVDQP
jgi:putative membrane protein insertion efficiency factor